MTRLVSLRIVYLALTIAIVGCQGKSGPEVVAYVAVDRVRAEPILQKFEAQSGIRVRAIYDTEAAKTTGLVTRIMAESEHPRCDVFWNNELAQTLLLADHNLLAPYDSPAASDIPNQSRDASGLWTATAQRARVIVYNTKYVSADEAPRGIMDLTQPRWRSQVAMANPQFGTTRTHAAAIFAALGSEAAEAFFNQLLENDIRIVDGNAMVKNLVARANPNASPVYVGLTDTDDVMAGQADGEPVAMIMPDQDDLGALIIPAAVSMIRGGPNLESGRSLIDFLVSPEVETQLAANKSGYFPVRVAKGGDDQLAPRGMSVGFAEIRDQLEVSSKYAQEHFHP